MHIFSCLFHIYTNEELNGRACFSFVFCFSATGSLLANLNHNNLKYGAEISRTPSFMQGAVTPVTGSPNKNLGPEKMILLVCNRACTGHQAKR